MISRESVTHRGAIFPGLRSRVPFLSLIILAALLHPLWSPAQALTTSFLLQPRKPQSLPLPLHSGQVLLLRLHLDGGIVGVRELGPAPSSRPLWLIDLGRNATLSYVVKATSDGTYSFEVTSFERGRPARLTVETVAEPPAAEAAAALLEAEDLLANAELLRRHWPGAPTGQNAATLYQNALTLAVGLNDIPLQRLILTQHARYLIFRGKDYAGGEAQLENAVKLASAGDEPQQALAWKTLSSVRYDLGAYQQAIEAGRTALHLYQLTGDVYWQGIVLGNLASVYSELGEAAEAVSAGRQALQDAEQTLDIAGVVYCLSQLANLYQDQGDLEDAMHTYDEGLRWVSHISYAPLVEAEIEKDLGGFYAQIGDWNRARLELRRCLALEEGQSDPVSLEARGLLATIMLQTGAPASAETEDSDAIVMARRMGLKQNEAELLLRRASAQEALKHPSLAVADIHAAQNLGRQLSSLPLHVETELALGDAFVSSHPEDAADAYRQSLQLTVGSGEREQQSRALAGLAKTLQRQGHWEEANDRIASALKIVESSRGSFTDREQQVTYFAMHRSWYELAVDICMQMDKRHPGEGYDRRAFDYTERARARSLLDTLNSSGYTAALPAPESLREEYARNQRGIAEQRASLTEAGEPARTAPGGQLENLQVEGDQLLSQIEAADSRLKSTFVGKTATSEEIQKQLIAGNSVLLSFWVGASHSYRWLFTAQSMSVETLPSRTELETAFIPLERRLQQGRPVPRSGDDVSAYARSQQAFESQIDDELARAGSMLLSRLPAATKSIMVVGDGCLMPLPFAALRIHFATGTDYALRKYAFFQEPSATVALYLKRHPAQDRPFHMAIFADPVASVSDPRLGMPSAETTGDLSLVNLPRLPGSLKEARAISQQAPRDRATLLTGFDASPEQVRALAPEDAVILHFAAHTVTLAKHPEATGIALSMWDRKGNRQPGVLWLKDIYSLHLPSALVVLSGCGTDTQSGVDGESLHNLSYAFFFAGAHAVIGSLWNVDDASTARLMGIFYSELLKDHQLTGDALRAAQLHMLAQATTRSPAVWAPFVLEGWPAGYVFTQPGDEAARLAHALAGERR